MKRFVIVILGSVLVTGLFLLKPQDTFAKSKITLKSNDPIVLIQYKGIPKKCAVARNDQVPTFGWGGWKLQSGITDYQINYSGIPSTISRDTMSQVVDLSFSTIQSAGGGVLFRYAGESSENNPSDDRRNTLMWKYLPVNIVAMTYIWIDDNNRLRDADTVFNKRYLWSYTNYTGQNDCGGKAVYFDLRDIATHEFGHWVGLGDLYDNNSRDLTMYGYAGRGELKKDTLGLGDINGIRAVWP